MTTGVQTLGGRLRQLRETADLSLRELARQLRNVTAAHLSDIEFGRRHPSDKLLHKLAGFFDVPIEELRKLDPRPPVREIRHMALQDPRYGLAFRKLVDHQVGAQEILNFIEELPSGEDDP